MKIFKIPEKAQADLNQMIIQKDKIDRDMKMIIRGLLLGMGIEGNNINVDLDKMELRLEDDTIDKTNNKPSN